VSGPPLLRFFGVRGSIPVPGPATARTGGNTPCVALDAPDAPLLVLDAGTGLRILGDSPLAAGRAIELLLTHTHWDHIHGLPFFQPLYQPDSRLRISGPRLEAGLRAVLERLAAPEHFPIGPSGWHGLAEVRELETSPVTAGPVTVRPTRLCHPGPTLGYRLEVPGWEPVAYLTDNELAGGAHGVGSGWRQGLVDFLAGCGVVIHDTTWDEGDVARHAGWGHSSPMQALHLAADAGCRKLVLFHHHPDHDDDRLERRRLATGEVAAGLGRVEVELAREGLVLALEREG
jgi:phosphoribosyl 1,2-cyclic phosphodiesterase